MVKQLVPGIIGGIRFHFFTISNTGIRGYFRGKSNDRSDIAITSGDRNTLPVSRIRRVAGISFI